MNQTIQNFKGYMQIGLEETKEVSDSQGELSLRVPPSEIESPDQRSRAGSNMWEYRSRAGSNIVDIYNPDEEAKYPY